MTFVAKFLFNCKVPVGKLIAGPRPDLHDDLSGGCKFYKQKRVGSVPSKARATAMGLRIQVKGHYLHFLKNSFIACIINISKLSY